MPTTSICETENGYTALSPGIGLNAVLVQTSSTETCSNVVLSEISLYALLGIFIIGILIAWKFLKRV